MFAGTKAAVDALAAGNQPDFRTIADFRKQHLPALSGLFEQVLHLALGGRRLGRVAVDGTKVKANASKHKAMSYGLMPEKELQFEAEVAELLAQAEATDADEDRRHGPDHRGDELPAELRRRESRLKRIREAKQALQDRVRETAAAADKSGTDARCARPKVLGCGTNPGVCCGSCVAPPRARPPPRRIARFRSLRHKLAAWLDGTPQTGASVTDGPRRGSPASPLPWSGCGPHRVGQSSCRVARMRPRVGIPLIPEDPGRDPGIKTSDRVHRGRVPALKGLPKGRQTRFSRGSKPVHLPLENRRMGGKRQPKVLSPRRPSAPRKTPAKTGVCPASVPLCPT